MVAKWSETLVQIQVAISPLQSADPGSIPAQDVYSYGIIYAENANAYTLPLCDWYKCNGR